MTMTNLGVIESRKRTIFGAAMLGAAVALTATYFYYDIRGPVVLILFIPFWLGVMGLLQGRAST
ncbi:MAG TPA: hypothetical protein VL754_18920 [Verrucomicrobiae bacterium]|jgi:hypothetical protein|nr:hypothetical protein [Verrucomicrobiae bacterium]